MSGKPHLVVVPDPPPVAAEAAGAAIHCRNLCLGYDRRPALRDLDWTVRPGSLTAVVGPNGAGKSTLLKGMVGVLTPLGGSIEIGGEGRAAIGYLPQQAEIDRSFPIAVRDMAAMGLWRRVGPFGAIGRDLAPRIEAALAAVGLGDLADRPIGALSGGQMQRLLFARLLLQDARVLLLDEPFTAIDARTAADLLALIGVWHREGRTIIAVLHDLDQVRRAFPETLLVARRVVALGPTAEVLSEANLERARLLCEGAEGR
ncbi:ABC transporter [Rhodospirillum rubrum]|uniref:metal ABC transporter ATP-binding protein n=1 Tax=Rhodospirillum rubrum TaxID=1085 RepID=UPI0019046B5F|nr:metal ABC transporter ATP-binding protein [Rhodospirillum rubrum]MBK1663501.1 ABC transporter [Rhodospirillum rubrum]MBK1675699.1 ABC transporter [Rhodospirillum rubrum]